MVGGSDKGSLGSAWAIARCWRTAHFALLLAIGVILVATASVETAQGAAYRSDRRVLDTRDFGSAAKDASGFNRLKVCDTTSENVIGHSVRGRLTYRHVTRSQDRLATCSHAKRVMDRVTGLILVKPKRIASFYCEPIVVGTRPHDAVKYICKFRGTRAHMYVKLTFSVAYNRG